MTRRHRLRRGVGALEFALTTPVLLFVVLGVVELGLLMHEQHVVRGVARDAARLASGVMEGPEPTGALIEDAAIAHARFALAEVGQPCTSGCRFVARWQERDGFMMIRVEVGVPHTPFTGFLPGLPDTADGAFTLVTQQQRPIEDLP